MTDKSTIEQALLKRCCYVLEEIPSKINPYLPLTEKVALLLKLAQLVADIAIDAGIYTESTKETLKDLQQNSNV